MDLHADARRRERRRVQHGRATAGGDKAKSTATGAAVGAAIGAAGGYLWSKNMQEQKAAMEQATQGTGVDVVQTPDNQLKLDIPSDISFDTGRYNIKPNMRPILDRLAGTLNQHPVTTVNIIGHTDSTGSDAVNNPPGTSVTILDRFATENEFYGGQLGAVVEYRRDRWSLDLRTTVALGVTNQRLTIAGIRGSV